ncbi:MAG: hypothetical protein DRQ37_08610, partial [Gammaproteobacteria bacterium]
ALWCVVLFIGSSGAVQAQEPAFRFGDRSFATADLAKTVQQTLYEAEWEFHQKRQQIIDTAVVDLYFDSEARKQGKSVEAVRREILNVPPPTDGQVRAFYDENKARIPAPFEVVRGDVARHLRSQQVDAKKTELVAKLKASGQYASLMPEPKAPVFDIDTTGYPRRGKAGAKVKLVDFADYQCPHCKQASATLNAVMKIYGDQVEWVFMDFPIIRSGISRKVAVGAVCAQQQGKFWEYHDLAFSRQGALHSESPGELALELDLDEAAFEKCYRSPESNDRVARSEEQARKLELNATPSLFINGRRVKLRNLEDGLVEAIEKALDEKS